MDIWDKGRTGAFYHIRDSLDFFCLAFFSLSKAMERNTFKAFHQTDITDRQWLPERDNGYLIKWPLSPPSLGALLDRDEDKKLSTLIINGVNITSFPFFSTIISSFIHIPFLIHRCRISIIPHLINLFSLFLPPSPSLSLSFWPFFFAICSTFNAKLYGS